MVVAVFAGSAVAPKAPSLNFTQTYSIAVGQNKSVVSPFVLNATSFFAVSYGASNEINFYLFNSTTFSPAKANNFSGITPILSILNNTQGNIPQLSNDSESAFQNSSILQSGTYYLVFQNTLPTATNVTYWYATVPISRITSSYVQNIFDASAIPSGLLIIGVILFAYGLVRSKKTDLTNKDVEAEKMYSKLSGSHSTKPRTGAHKNKKKSSR